MEINLSPSPLQYKKTGKGHPVVLLHGWAMNGLLWGSFAESLAESYEVINTDLPGHGNSRDLTQPFTIKDTAAKLANMISEPTVIIGWSLGGMIALQTAVDFPNKVLGVVTLCSTPKFVQNENWHHAIKPTILTQFCKDLRQNYEKTIQRFLALQVLGCDHQRKTRAQLNSLLGSLSRPQTNALTGGLEQLQNYDMRNLYKQIQQPVLSIFGERDPLVPCEVTDDIQTLSNRITTQVIEKSGHAPFLSHRLETLSMINPFLNKLLLH